MSIKYQDPSNTEEILDNIRLSQTLGEIKNILDNTFPGWFVGMLPKFSDDYPNLTDSWNKICLQTNSEKKQIIIVDEINPDKDKHSLIYVFIELFTKMGFIVRTKQEIIPCEKCGCALPTQLNWSLYKKAKINIPEKWSQFCTKCQ